jgi:hypothetical protein
VDWANAGPPKSRIARDIARQANRIIGIQLLIFESALSPAV